MGELVLDVLEKILITLDVKDLIRFKCVCKSWHALISNPCFIKSHLHHSYNNDVNSNNGFRHRRIVMSRFCCGYFDSNTLGCYEVNDHHFDTHNCHLIGSSNGLVCISPSDAQVIVANPLTREVKLFRNPEIPYIMPLCWGFGYDRFTDDYKVLLGFRKSDKLTCFQMLSLKANVWKVVGEVDYTCMSRIGTLCNGSLHWFMDDQNLKKVILSFDLSKEELKEIPQPNDPLYKFTGQFFQTMSLGTMEEKLCVFKSEMYPDKIWIMKNYNVKQSWELMPCADNMKYDIVTCLKELKDYIPKKSILYDNTCLFRTKELIGYPIFVQSLVTPHIQNPEPQRANRVTFMDKGLKGKGSEADSNAFKYVNSAIAIIKGSEIIENGLQNNRRLKRKSQTMDSDRSTKLIKKDPLLVDKVVQFDDLLVNRVPQFDAIKAVKLAGYCCMSLACSLGIYLLISSTL